MTKVIYGSTTGNAEEIAQKIAEALGSECVNIKDASAADFEADKLVLGSSTWGDGDLQDDWESFDLDGIDFSGKTVALFSVGDSSGYPDTFCQAMAIIYDKVVAKGGKVVGSVSTDGYSFDSSEAVKDGKFVGLALDNDNESDKTDDRINAWIAEIKPSLS